MSNFIGYLWNTYISPKDCYRLVTRLRGHKAPINCLAFTRDGEFLASGGDDEVICIWALKTNSCHQVLQDHGKRWGQITCLKWLSSEAGSTGLLCFGTGRGIILIYRRSKPANQLVEMSSTSIFPASDSVEAIAYDPVHNRLVAMSHFGQVQAYTLEKNRTFIKIWGVQMDSTIPRAVHFLDNYQNVVVFSLEKGEMTLRDAVTSKEIWSKTLKSGIGSIDICPNEKYILVENLSIGFDLYHMSRTSPLRSFDISTTRKFIKAGSFTENTTIVVCGSDHGNVYIFGVASGEKIQVLNHNEYVLQTLDTISTNDRHLIASGTSGGRYDICLWEKLTIHGSRKKHEGPRVDVLSVLNGIVLFLLFWWTSDIWMNKLQQGTDNIFNSLYDKALHHASQCYVVKSPVTTFDHLEWAALLKAQEAQEAKDMEAMDARYERLREMHRAGPLAVN